MRNSASFTLGAAGLLFVMLPIPSYAEDCRGLRFACEHKDELGLQGLGTCRRFQEQCPERVVGVSDQRCRQLRWVCEHKDELGLEGAGSCRRFREACE